jgi:diguanylate cyclase (GGDEF)-like protein/PAS domain S-box-containing protein
MNAPDTLAPSAARTNIAIDLARYQILDTPPEAAFDDLARRAAEAFAAPMAAISFFECRATQPFREWFKARVGFADAITEAGAETCFFLPAIDPAIGARGTTKQPSTIAPFVISDALADKRVRDFASVTGPPYICFYAGAAIYSRRRELLGVLAVFDTAAREATASELAALVNLAELVSARMAARVEARTDAPHQALLPATSSVVTSAFAPKLADSTSRTELIRLQQRLEDEISARHAIEAKFDVEKHFSAAATEAIAAAFYLIDRDLRLVRWNKSFQIASGFADVDLRKLTVLDLVIESDRPAVTAAVREVFEHGKEVTVDATLRSPSGVEVTYTLHGAPIELGGLRYCIGAGRDLSARKRAEREMIVANERLDLALTSSNLAMWDWDLTTNTVFFNHGWSRLLGALPLEATMPGPEVIALTHEEDREGFQQALFQAIKGETAEINHEYRVPTGTGDWVWLHTIGKVTERNSKGHSIRLTGTSANVTKRKYAEERVEFLATRDPLTGLPNRMLVHDRLEQGIAKAARNKAQLAFMFIDLDRFKTINDSLGHDVGDELLKRVAARLSACVRASDTVARLGGDEFAVILDSFSADEHDGAQNVAEKMIASLASPIMINGQHLNTSCSIGISMFPSDGQDEQTLMKHADVAMYDAKAKGRNNYQFFSHQMNAKAQERLSIENYLRLAMRRNELVLHYQPRVSFATGQVTGMEALIRWQHPRHGLILPTKFIGVAEDAGLIVAMGEWVIETAFAQLATWQKKSSRELKLAINLSVGQMVDGDRLIRAVKTSAAEVNLDTSTLEFELTESMLLKNTDETAAILQRLGDLGIGIAIDDFGTGYSSLSYLKQLPVDCIKVDSSFVRDIGTDPNDEAIIRAIIAMTHSLKLNVVAEGVENEDQYRVLRDLECDEYQGFFFSKALPAVEFEAQFLDV